jgi:uracil-DNA glycosylase
MIPLADLLREIRACRRCDDRRATLTQRVRDWRSVVPRHWPLPHPSPRNQAWFKSNPWFDSEVLPALRAHLAGLGFHEEKP